VQNLGAEKLRGPQAGGVRLREVWYGIRPTDRCCSHQVAAFGGLVEPYSNRPAKDVCWVRVCGFPISHDVVVSAGWVVTECTFSE
jgi:hypothetical protein